MLETRASSCAPWQCAAPVAGGLHWWCAQHRPAAAGEAV